LSEKKAKNRLGALNFQKTRIILATVLVSVISTSTLSVQPSLASNSAQASHNYQVATFSALPKPKITQAFSANRLSVSRVKKTKKTKISYQWLANGIDLPGETSKSYEWQVPDCPQNVQVRVVSKEKGKKKTSRLSKPFSPESCFFSTGDLPAWGVLHDCGTQTDRPRCTEWTYTGPGGFSGYVYRSEKNQSWFRVPIPGIEPSRVISWRAHAKGIGRTWALALVMISKNEPSWACCDWKGTKFPPVGSLGSQVSDEVTGLSPDGGAYVGFDYYDKFKLSELFTLQTIEIQLKYR
jgi:hypothetical protein